MSVTCHPTVCPTKHKDVSILSSTLGCLTSDSPQLQYLSLKQKKTPPFESHNIMAVWKALFMNHISKLSSPEFVLTSLHPAPEGTSPVPYAPRLRYCIFRGMYGELPENPHNPAPMNEHVYESDLPTFTTDVRMEKVPDIFATSAGHGSVSQSQGSGGGGPVEAVFWVKEVMTQWRLRGEAFVIGPDIEGEGEGSSGVRTVKSELAKRMRLVKEGREAEWSWGRELTAHFGNMSPAMRGG